MVLAVSPKVAKKVETTASPTLFIYSGNRVYKYLGQYHYALALFYVVFCSPGVP